MHFISQIRFNPESGKDEKYYRIKESFRDKLGRARSRILLNVGFWSELSPEEVRDVGKGLTCLQEHQGEKSLFDNPFEGYSEGTQKHIALFWKQMAEAGVVDLSARLIKESEEEARRMIDTATMKHTDAREVGAEWTCLQAIRQLKLEEFLKGQGWSETKIKATISMLITRAVYSPSELKSLRIMQDNSAVCELVYGNQKDMPSYKMTYKAAPELYKIKEDLEKHLCAVTDNLFNQENRILLFDLTNTYFEGRKEGSEKARFGRSKEKRTDCRLLVLALCINTDGFIRYSSILEGNTADPKSLPDMIEHVIKGSPLSDNSKALVVIDAGIATEENLALIKERGFNYLCVSRTRFKEYEPKPFEESVPVKDCTNQDIRLTEVRRAEGGDYYLQVSSEKKEAKENSMNTKLKQRFLLELEKAKTSVATKGGTKRYEKVIERVGRAMEKYPSVAQNYIIEYERSEENPDLMGNLTWKEKETKRAKEPGVYFLRTNITTLDEKSVWDYYNLIREIECTNRQLKTDLNLRPICHQTDERCEAHIFFGLLAYWIVNTIRLQLKRGGVHHYWTEIVRILSTQKAVTTEAANALGEKVQLRICSDPPPQAQHLYNILKYKTHPLPKNKNL